MNKESSSRRNICEVTSLFLVLACTRGEPKSESLKPVEDQPTIEVYAGFEHQPERVVEPIHAPQFEVVARSLAPEEQEELCVYEVEHRGFPAISEDGAILVQAYDFTPTGADETSARLELSWLDATNVRVELIYDRQEDRPWVEDWPGCDVAVARVREKVAALNAELAARSWRPLEPLDVLFSEPGYAYEIRLGEEIADIDAVFTNLAFDDRPVEVFYDNGHFIGRVRALRVLQDTARPEWNLLAASADGFDPEICPTDAQISAIEFDHSTRLALVHYNFSTAVCGLCDDRSHFGRIELSPELLAEVERRSTTAFMTALEQADPASP
jgi:hypothetical protein